MVLTSGNTNEAKIINHHFLCARDGEYKVLGPWIHAELVRKLAIKYLINLKSFSKIINTTYYFTTGMDHLLGFQL